MLDPKVIALLSAPHAAIPGSTQSYGYGLEIGEWRGVHVVHHSGSRAGYGSEIRMAPKERVAVIVQTNRSGATLPETTDKALEMLLPLGPAESAKKSAVPLTGEDLKRNAGTFRNGDERIEIIAREQRLYLKRGAAAETPMIKYGERITDWKRALRPSPWCAAATERRSTCTAASGLSPASGSAWRQEVPAETGAQYCLVSTPSKNIGRR